MTAHHRILLVDDNQAIHDDFRKILCGQAHNPSLEAAEAVLFDLPAITTPFKAHFETDSVFQGQDALAKVQESIAQGRPYPMAFVDGRMPPGWDGIETIEQLWKVDPALQIVLCTAYSDHSWEEMTARLGINENLFILKKPFDNIEVVQLAHALIQKWQMTQQAALRMEALDRMVEARTKALRSANTELGRSEERFSKAFRASPIPLAIQTFQEDRIVDINEAFVTMTGFARNELLGRTPLEIGLSIEYEPLMRQGLSEDTVVSNAKAQISSKSGELKQALVSIEPISLAQQPHVLVMVQDITERLRLETQLRQSQKMEAIGQLAAGIAHDFNNLLTIIEGHASLQLTAAIPGITVKESLEQIEQAAERAAELTRQLLTFSRRQIIRRCALELDVVVRNLTAMLKRLIGDHITLKCSLPKSLPLILADRTSIEQIIMNLALNARDAMPKGGAIAIRAKEVTVTAEACQGEIDAVPGQFVCLSVSDNGVGMDESTCSRIFEPFFTTKAVDKGTGMGLATVYGVVKQHEGWVEVTTAPGKGSTFQVFLPITMDPLESAPVLPAPTRKSSRKHTVLIVEDEEAVRHLVREILVPEGYRILEAIHAEQAMETWFQHRDEVDLLLTDLVMPGNTNGLELAEILRKDRPELKVVYSSGYSSDLFQSKVKLQEGVNYLPKPYLSSRLLAILHNVLETN